MKRTCGGGLSSPSKDIRFSALRECEQPAVEYECELRWRLTNDNLRGNLVGSTKNQGQPLCTRRQGSGLVDIRRPVNKGFHLDKEDEKERKCNESPDS